MKKLLLFFIITTQLFGRAEVESFGYSWEKMQHNADTIPSQIRTLQLKKYGARGALFGLIGLYVYQLYTSGAYVPGIAVPPSVTDSMVEKCKNAGLVVIKWAGSALTTALATQCVTKSQTWFTQMDTVDQFMKEYTQLQDPAQRGVFLRINPQKQISQQVLINVMQDQYRQMAHYNSFEMIIAELQTLSVLQDAEMVKERTALLETKFTLLMADIMKVMGYLQYRQKQIAESHTLIGVQIQTTLEIMDKAAINFCNTCSVLLEACKAAIDFTQRAEKTIQLQEAVENYANLFYADLHSIKNYARG